MDMDKMAYPEIFVVSGVELKGRRDMKKGTVLIPYTDEPDVGIGDVISQKSGQRMVSLKVLDCSFLEDGTLNVGTRHNNMLTLIVENSTAEPFKSSTSSTINIGSISSDQVQVGNHNTQITNITVQRLVEQIAKSKDAEAKSKLKEFLQNSTVASVIGAGATALLALL